jgi:YlmC/YmxH family sporulation protein
MRYSELGSKEIIDVDHGERMGMLGSADFLIDEQSGTIESIILPSGGFLGLGKKQEEVVIPWRSIRKVGPEMIIVELKQYDRY